MKTELKPYKHSLYSPHNWPPEVGQLVILLDEPRGYVGILMSADNVHAKVKLLDSQDGLIDMELSALIPTGKTPQDLISQYEVSDLNLSRNLQQERSIPDFSRIKKTTKKGGVKKKKILTEANKLYLAGVIKAALAKVKET